MNVRELYDWLGENTTDDDIVQLEVGGDGAIHTGELRTARRDHDTNVVTLSYEDALT